MTHFVRGAAIFGAALACACASSTTEGVGRCGAYQETPGTAHVTAVDAAPAGENNCPSDPVEITFDFTPDDPALASLAAAGRTVTIFAGMNPPSAAVAACGLTVGSDHPAVRRDEQAGRARRSSSSSRTSAERSVGPGSTGASEEARSAPRRPLRTDARTAPSAASARTTCSSAA